MPVTLILGGARSGKSRRAAALAEAARAPVVFVATARPDPDDAEWCARLDRHRRERPPHWNTVEEPLALCSALRAHSTRESVVLVDCLTLWLANLLAAEREPEQEAERLAALLPELPGRVLLVSNEVGLGPVPLSPLGRRFRDAQGVLNQRVAAAAQRVELVAAGLPLALKGGAA